MIDFKKFLNEEKHIPSAMKDIKEIKRKSEIKEILQNVLNGKFHTFAFCITSEDFSKNYMTERSIHLEDIDDIKIRKFFSKHRPPESKDDYPVLTVTLDQKKFDEIHNVKNSILCYDGFKFFVPIL